MGRLGRVDYLLPDSILTGSESTTTEYAPVEPVHGAEPLFVIELSQLTTAEELRREQRLVTARQEIQAILAGINDPIKMEGVKRNLTRSIIDVGQDA
jgi:hypothetical protein